MFEAGNKFYLLRSKHGRDRLFSDPEALWDAALEYFQYCDSNPWPEQDWVGKDAIEVTRYKKVPYTWSGLALYCDCSINTIKACKDVSSDFLTIFTRIEQTIYSQKLTGAANGFFNANIIARDLGLADKTQNDHTVNMEKPGWLGGNITNE